MIGGSCILTVCCFWFRLRVFAGGCGDWWVLYIDCVLFLV